MNEIGPSRAISKNAAPQKQIQKRKKTLKRILTAAEIVFAENGYYGASFGKVAQQAGIPKSNVLYYFPSKETLYRTVVEDIFEVWREAAQCIHVESDPAESLGEYIETKLDLARARPFGSKVWANEIMHGAPIVQDYLESDLIAWTKELEAVILRWIAQGRLNAIEPRTLIYMIWASTQHYADFQQQIETINGGKPFDDEDWQATKEAMKVIILRSIMPQN